MDGPRSHPGDSTPLKSAADPAAALAGAEESRPVDIIDDRTSLPPAALIAPVNAASALTHSSLSPSSETSGLPVPVPRYHVRAPSNALKLDTDLALSTVHNPVTTAADPLTLAGNGNEARRHSATAPIAIQEGYLRSAWSTASIGSLSPASAFSSPALNALGDLTPLPSPLVMSDSPGPWQRALPRPRSRGASSASRDDSVLTFSKGMLSPSPSMKRKGYTSSLKNAAVEAAAAQNHHKNEPTHGRNRSLSEYTADTLHHARIIPSAVGVSRSSSVSQSHVSSSIALGQHRDDRERLRPHESSRKDLSALFESDKSSMALKNTSRSAPFEVKPTISYNHHADMITPNESSTPEAVASKPQQLHREQYLAPQRGLVSATASAGLPTPPASNASNRSVTDTEEDDVTDDDKIQYMVVRHGPQKTKKFWRPIRQLGQGTFSKVYLATSEKIKIKGPLDESILDPRKLVAIKIVEHGPAGGADEERVELSLKREVEMLRSVSHPSLVHLQAFDYDDAQAHIVLTYCPGGDLFDVASDNGDKLTVGIVQRIFAEMVSAVRYLHKELIVHRDIKLENVLLNIPISILPLLKDPQRHAYAIATLTDLGLSRRIPAPPESPLLTTRCGSEDYAAPEILLGQPYDGRATDAWALGVLLYTLMEGRLPFDPPPGKAASRSRAAHRIARCDWEWVNLGNEDGEWDAVKGQEWASAHECVEGLLKKVSRGRKSLEDIEKMEWVQQGIQVPGGLKNRLEDEASQHYTGDDLLR